MNILFYTTYEVSPYKGGTERITSTLATTFEKQYSHNCFSMYNTSINANLQRTHFKKKYHVSLNNFENEFYLFLKENNIDIIINQGAFDLTKKMRSAINKYGRGKLITAHHFSPGSEELFFNRHNLRYSLKNKKIRLFIKEILFPLLRIIHNYKIKKSYLNAYNYSDCIVLLSEKFKNQFIKYSNIKSESKFYYIPNSLSFSSFYDMEAYEKKVKEVLIVSRLDNIHKRISLALKIWKEIEKNKLVNDWKLTIVGHGEEYEQELKQYIIENQLNHVQLVGMKNPIPYYRKASIFMMTSLQEGWGLTLTEAQQNGVVPIAFNSYASITDIIEDGYSGFLIPERNEKAFIKKMILLMEDNELRKQLASNAVSSSRRFKIDIICDKWNNLFSQISL